MTRSNIATIVSADVDAIEGSAKARMGQDGLFSKEYAFFMRMVAYFKARDAFCDFPDLVDLFQQATL